MIESHTICVLLCYEQFEGIFQTLILLTRIHSLLNRKNKYKIEKNMEVGGRISFKLNYNKLIYMSLTLPSTYLYFLNSS